jgi:hypothetical protein
MFKIQISNNIADAMEIHADAENIMHVASLLNKIKSIEFKVFLDSEQIMPYDLGFGNWKRWVKKYKNETPATTPPKEETFV